MSAGNNSFLIQVLDQGYTRFVKMHQAVYL